MDAKWPTSTRLLEPGGATQARVDAGLPARALLAEIREHVGIEPKLDRLLRRRRRRPAGSDHPLAYAELGAGEHVIGDFRRIVIGFSSPKASGKRRQNLRTSLAWQYLIEITRRAAPRWVQAINTTRPSAGRRPRHNRNDRQTMWRSGQRTPRRLHEDRCRGFRGWPRTWPDRR